MKTWKKALGLVLAFVCLMILSGGGLAESVTCDGVTLTGDPLVENTNYTFDKDTHLLTIKTAGEYTLSGTASNEDFRVKVGDRLVTTLTLDNLTINTDNGYSTGGYSPLDFSDAGATTLILVGENQLIARNQNPAVYAPKMDGDENLAIQLTIQGDGSLAATGGMYWPGIGNNGSAKICIEGGDIRAIGGLLAAGIGGGQSYWFDSIVIEGGHVVATGGAWAGALANDIGCGYAPSGKPDHGHGRRHTISITGGVVEADRIFREAKGGETLTQTGGILVQNGEYTVLGDTKLTTNLTIPEGKTLTVPRGKTITIEKNGKLEIEKGATLKIEEGATLVIKDGAMLKSEDGATLVMNGITGYGIEYDLNGGEWAKGYKPEDYYLPGTGLELPTEENLNKVGYTFAGWKEKGKKDVVWKIPATAAGIKNVVAQWKANTYTVKFDVNGGTVGTQTKTVTHGDLYGELPTPTRDGYTFAGWYDDNSNPVTKDTVVTTAKDHKLYAHWKANTYTVTFEANEGTVETKTQTVTYGSTYGELPTPTREGYEFAGWFTEQNGGMQVMADTKVTTAADRTLYARWTQNLYTVTIKADKDGDVIETQQIPEGGLAKKPAKEPVREGYTFVGWQANGAAWDFDKNTVERETEIVALWEKVVPAPTPAPAPEVAIEGGTSFIAGKATENAMVTIGHNVPGFGVANLAYVDVDGKKLDEKDYDAKTGSIKLNVHAAYLNTLSAGEHTLTAHLKGDGYDGQKISVKFAVSPVPDASGLPKTGDASAPMAWCALGLACLAGLAAMKRRK